MLLSTCFLLFILWLCCFTAMNEKKVYNSSTRTNQFKRCLIETESNLNKIGIHTSSMPTLTKLAPITTTSCKKPYTNDDNTIYVRDAATTTTTTAAANSDGNLKLEIGTHTSTDTRRPDLSSVSISTLNNNKKATTTIMKNETIKSSTRAMSSRSKPSSLPFIEPVAEQLVSSERGERIFHPYDSLHLKIDSVSSNNSKQRQLSETAGSTRADCRRQRPSDGHINLAFMNDYEYFNGEKLPSCEPNK